SLDLEALPSSVQIVEGLKIERVRTAQALEIFARLTASNWQPPDQSVVEFYRRGAHAVLSDPSPQWFYIGFLDSDPVATTEVTIGGGVAGLYNISTLSRCRGRGIGSAMTHQTLTDARAAGC